MTFVVAGSASVPFASQLASATGMRLARAEAKRFPDGEGYVRLLDDVGGHDVAVVQTTSPDAGLVELLLWLDAARENGATRVTAVVPYFAYARQDRAFQVGEGVSARAVARAIAASADDVILVDPHKEEILDFFAGKARAVSAVPILADHLATWGVDTVLAPDKGARARAATAARRMGVRVDHLEKTRLSATEVVMKTKELDVRGARVAILDDLVASGSTMITAAKQLKAQGAASVVAACTHGLFTGNALPNILAGGIDRVLCTDTYLSGPCSCDVISAAPAVAAALSRTKALA